MHKKRSRLSQSPVRVRQEPPTVAEAVAAAQALTPDREQQVDITAGLIGLTPEEARPFVLEAPPLTLPRSAAPQRGYAGAAGGRGSAGRWLLSSADHGWRAMNFGRGGGLFGRGSSNRRAKELSSAGIPLGAKLGCTARGFLDTRCCYAAAFIEASAANHSRLV